MRITLFDYDESGELRNEYSKSFRKNGRNPFPQLSEIVHPDSLIAFVDASIPDSIPYSNYHRWEREKEEFYNSYLDTNGFLVKEFWTVEMEDVAYRTVEKYDENGKLVYSYKKTPYNEGVDEFKFNSKGQLVEEIETWDIETNSFQKKLHQYDGLLLTKTEFFHDTSLAFIYQFNYQDTLLVSKTTDRITDSEHFKNRRRHEKVKYEYEYF